MTYSDYDSDSENRINGYAAEMNLHRAILDSRKTNFVDLSGSFLAEAIESDWAGLKHLKSAEIKLIEEFGVFKQINGKAFLTAPDLKDLPQVTVLDYVLGVDYLVNYAGHIIAIDATVNASSVAKKLRKKRELTRVFAALQVDKTLILVVSDNFDTENLHDVLREVIRSDGYHQVRGI
jgi:hypothetical protein